jgi:hypothetical protein
MYTFMSLLSFDLDAGNRGEYFKDPVLNLTLQFVEKVCWLLAPLVTKESHDLLQRYNIRTDLKLEISTYADLEAMLCTKCCRTLQLAENLSVEFFYTSSGHRMVKPISLC